MKVESIFATQLYGNNKQAIAQADPTDGPGFADALEKALNDLRSSVQTGEAAAMDAMAGKGDVQTVVEALTATEMALETATVVRDKVVEAYQEIMRMPV